MPEGGRILNIPAERKSEMPALPTVFDNIERPHILTSVAERHFRGSYNRRTQNGDSESKNVQQLFVNYSGRYSERTSHVC